MKRFLKSFRHASRGIYENFKLGTNAKVQGVAAILTIGVSFAIGFNTVEWIIIILCIAMVFSLETINTSIELLSDEITRERKPTIRRIKDLAAGAVLITSIAATIIFIILFSQHLVK